MDNHPDIGILGCRLTNPDGTMQPSARMLPGPLNKILHITGLAARFPNSKFFGRVDYTWWNHSEPKTVGWVVGAYFLIRRETMKNIGPLDDRYFLYFEEIDYCLSARRAGWKVVFYPYASVIHLGGQSSAKSGQKMSAKGRQMIAIRITSEFRYYRKLYGGSHVMLAAGIELVWNALLYYRNTLRASPLAVAKKDEAKTVIKLILRTLRMDNWGKGSLKKGSTII
jgi:GT2 family glycosyltransferase